MRTSKPVYLTSVQNSIRLLKCFTETKPIWKVTDLAKELNLAKSTVSRIIATLVNEGFIIKTENSSAYRLGLAVLTLGGVVTSNIEMLREAEPVLNQVVSETGETAHLAILDGLDTIYVKKEVSTNLAQIATHVGRKNPSYAISSGKVLLAYSDPALVDAVIEKGLEKLTQHTITNPEQFRFILNKIRQQGYAVSREELTEGVNSIAAPIRDYRGNVVSSLNIVGPAKRMKPHKFQDYIRSVVNAAKDASERLGYDERYFK